MFTRRKLLAGAGATAVLPLIATSAEAAPAFVAWHGKTGAEHQALLNENAAKGFRTSSLCVYGPPNDPRYVSVMVKRPTVVAQEQVFGINGLTFGQKVQEMLGKGWAPVMVSATGPLTSAVFAVVFRPGAPFSEIRPAMTREQFDDKNEAALASGKILVWADAYGTPQDTRYVAIWAPNTESAAWNCQAIDEDLGLMQARSEALASSKVRASHIAVTPSQNYVGLFTDTTLGTWTTRGNMTAAQYQAEFNIANAKGQFPLRVSAKGEGANTRFAAVFATREATDPRVFRAKGPSSNATVDSIMETFIKAHDLRGGTLAITVGSKLVYARGYTWAEASPIYPDIHPTTLFRQASVSKSMVAVALYRLMQQDPQVTLETTMQSILNLKKPNGSNANADFSSIKLKHLIESNSGLNQNLAWSGQQAANEFGANLPATQEQLARLGAKAALPGTPGDTSNVVYGNYDYFLLSQVVTKLAGAPTFEAALKTLVLDPLGMKRTRSARSLIADQANDEARYHLRVYETDPDPGTLYPLVVAPSVRTEAQPWVPYQYGCLDYELLDGCAGISSAIVDIARLNASFSAGPNNPVLNEATAATMLLNALNCSATYSGPDAHGYHGFDIAQMLGNIFIASKGGWLASHESAMSFVLGGVGFSVAFNGNKKADVAVDWTDDLYNYASTANWGTTDLFPTFGMPSFGGGPVNLGVKLPPKFKQAFNPNLAIAKVARATKRTLRLDPKRPLRQRRR